MFSHYSATILFALRPYAAHHHIMAEHGSHHQIPAYQYSVFTGVSHRPFSLINYPGSSTLLQQLQKSKRHRETLWVRKSTPYFHFPGLHLACIYYSSLPKPMSFTQQSYSQCDRESEHTGPKDAKSEAMCISPSFDRVLCNGGGERQTEGWRRQTTTYQQGRGREVEGWRERLRRKREGERGRERGWEWEGEEEG